MNQLHKLKPTFNHICNEKLLIIVATLIFPLLQIFIQSCIAHVCAYKNHMRNLIHICLRLFEIVPFKFEQKISMTKCSLETYLTKQLKHSIEHTSICCTNISFAPDKTGLSDQPESVSLHEHLCTIYERSMNRTIHMSKTKVKWPNKQAI